LWTSVEAHSDTESHVFSVLLLAVTWDTLRLSLSVSPFSHMQDGVDSSALPLGVVNE
jgi:hypothetical protein